MLYKKRTFLVCMILLLLAWYWQACKKYSPYIQKAKPEVTINTGDNRLSGKTIHFSNDTVYILSTNLIRDSGQDLTFDAGTLIRINDNLSITIRQGATIHANGTSTQPVVFTSTALPGTAGVGVAGNAGGGHSWQGLWIYGNAAAGSTAGSGNLAFVRIEFAGGSFSSAIGSLLLQNVTKATTIDHVQVSYSFRNVSFEFAGGDCDARYLVSYASSGADFNLHLGYKGKMQNLLAYRHAYFPDHNSDYYGGALTGMLIQDDTTLPSISNLTVLGPDPAQISDKYSDAGHVAGFIALSGAGFHIRNSVFLGFPTAGWYLDDPAVASAVANGQSDLTWSIVHCSDSTKAFYLAPGTYGTATSADFKNFMLQPPLGNQQFLNIAAFMLTDPFNYDIHPDPTPKTGSPLLSGASFTTPFDDAFFNKVDYRGALGSDSWLKDWTNFIPLQTNYNN